MIAESLFRRGVHVVVVSESFTLTWMAQVASYSAELVMFASWGRTLESPPCLLGIAVLTFFNTFCFYFFCCTLLFRHSFIVFFDVFVERHLDSGRRGAKWENNRRKYIISLKLELLGSMKQRKKGSSGEVREFPLAKDV